MVGSAATSAVGVVAPPLGYVGSKGRDGGYPGVTIPSLVAAPWSGSGGSELAAAALHSGWVSNLGAASDVCTVPNESSMLRHCLSVLLPSWGRHCGSPHGVRAPGGNPVRLFGLDDGGAAS